MTDKAIDYNIGKLLYFFNQKVQIEKGDNSAKWFIDRFTWILDYNGGARDAGPIHLEEQDFREVKEYVSSDIIREFSSSESQSSSIYEPPHLGVIVCLFNGYNIAIYKVKNLPTEIIPLQSLNNTNQ